MGKIWLKSIDPAKQCCGCEGKSGPCDSCCSNKVFIQDEFVQSENEIYNNFFLRKTLDTVLVSDETLSWTLGGDNTNSVDRACLIKAKKGQRFNLSFGEQKQVSARYLYQLNVSEISSPSTTCDSYYGDFIITKNYNHTIDSFSFSANKSSIYDYFDLEFGPETSISINQFRPNIFYFTETDKISARASYSFVENSIYSTQKVYTNLGFFANPFLNTFSSTPFCYSQELGVPTINATPPNGAIKEILVYASFLTDDFLTQNYIIPPDQWASDGRNPIGTRAIIEDRESAPYRIYREIYLQYIENPNETTNIGPFEMSIIAKRASCLQIFFNDTYNNISPISISSDKKISFSELTQYVP